VGLRAFDCSDRTVKRLVESLPLLWPEAPKHMVNGFLRLCGPNSDAQSRHGLRAKMIDHGLETIVPASAPA
jgi:hypothetical protein